jgi:uncharacterized membrane protein YebE (DUF533 family)
MSEPSESAETPYMAVLRVWAAMAWADGVIAPAEAEALRRLVAVAPIQPAEREVALAWLDQPVELDTRYVSRLSSESRRGVYRAAVRLARVDLHVADQERALLDQLKDALGLDGPAAEAIEAEVSA